MGRQTEATVQRLRRLARALVQDVDGADALVLETLSIHERRATSLQQRMTTLIGLRRKREDGKGHSGSPVRPRPGGNHPEVIRAFDTLPLADREVLALIAVEHLDYDDAAAILGLPLTTFITRLTRARESLNRVVEGERHVVLRVVK